MIDYPFDCIQILSNHWWEKAPKVEVGSLLLCMVPYFQTSPLRLTPMGRPIPTSHGSATIRLEKCDIDTPSRPVKLPVAGLTTKDKNEVLLAFVGKPRPVVVLADHSILAQGVGHQKQPTLLVAPYYSVKPVSGGRAGFPDAFVQEVVRGVYPQFLWDVLPKREDNSGSLLRFDRVISIPKYTNEKERYYKPQGYRLSAEALAVYTEWFQWSITKRLKKESPLAESFELLRDS